MNRYIEGAPFSQAGQITIGEDVFEIYAAAGLLWLARVGPRRDEIGTYRVASRDELLAHITPGTYPSAATSRSGLQGRAWVPFMRRLDRAIARSCAAKDQESMELLIRLYDGLLIWEYLVNSGQPPIVVDDGRPFE